MMQEILYNIEINKGEGRYQGKIFSDFDSVREFKNKRLDMLLRDIIVDMQLDLDEFTNRSIDFEENLDEVRF